MDNQTLKELTKKISGRKFDEEKFDESVKIMDEPHVEKEEDEGEELQRVDSEGAELQRDDSEGAELQRVDSKGFSQQSQAIYDNIDNKLYLSSKI